MMHIRSILHLASISVFADPCFVGELSLTRPYWSGHCWPALPQTCSGISWWNFHQRATCAAWCRLPVAFAFVKFGKYNGEIFTREQYVLLGAACQLLLHLWRLGNTIVKFSPESRLCCCLPGDATFWCQLPVGKCICEVWEMQSWNFHQRRGACQNKVIFECNMLLAYQCNLK